MALIEFHTDTERVVEVPWLLNRIGKPRRILDIGSAGGVYFPALVDSGAEVWLVDERPITDIPHQAHVWRGNAADLPAEWTGYFDLVTCISSLDHVGLAAYGRQPVADELAQTVQELARVTLSGGRLLLTVPAGRDLTTQHGVHGGQRVFSLDALGRLFGSGWEWLNVSTWRLAGNHYEPCTVVEIEEAGYAGHRAAAVAAVELWRR